MSKRRTTLAVTVLTLAVVAAACGGDDDVSEPSPTESAEPDSSTPSAGETTAPDESSAGDASAACAGEPVSGGDLVYGRQAETFTFDPLNVRNGNGDIFADGLVYEGLVRYDPTGSTEIVGGVAESWDVSDDGLTYTFRLRPDVMFSNGDAVTVDDVKFSLDRFGDPEVNAIMSVLTTGYESSEIVDDSTFRVHLSEPVPAFLDNIAVFPAYIVPKALVEEQGDAFWEAPVGSGPFMVDEFVSGSHVTFVRNPHYWDTGKPYLDSVRFNFAVDANSRLLALRSGDVQAVDGVSPSQIDSLQEEPDLVLKSFSIPAWIQIFPNHQRPQLADLNVRLAIASAIDHEAINDQIFGGLGTIPNSIMPQLKYDAGPDVVAPYSYDLDRAKEYMAASDFPDGFSLTLEYPTGLDYYNQLTLLVQSQLAEIGIDIELVKLDPSTMVDSWRSEEYDLNFAFPMLTSDIAVPDEFALFYGDAEGGSNGFHTNWKDEDISAMVKDFVSNPDDAARAELWPQIQQAFMDQQPMFSLIDVPLLNAYADNVCGTEVNALGVDQLQNAWFAGAAG